ncbi:MAG TPA: aldo/keto reductase [Candidatus Limnocylindria bacterium]|nr:aldo/keto reductase [Candidatus Limnocylindria bacterium]
MDTVSVGASSIQVSRLAYGCWRILGPESAEPTAEREASASKAITAAFEAGFTFFDHADVYADGAAEKVFGDVLKQVSGMRERVVITTKCGIRRKGVPNPDSPYRYDFSAEHITRSCEQSLKRLGIETIDVYQLHRPDYLMDPAEVAGAFEQLKQQGKVREFGVSNFQPHQLSLLQRACSFRLVVHQVEISLAKLNCLEDGTLDQCLSEKIAPLAWSPLAGGRLSDTLPIDINSPEHARRIGLRETLDEIARDYGVTRAIVALAWLLKHPAKIIPVIGTAKPERIREASQAYKLQLSRDEWHRLLEAARGERLP